MKDISIYNGSMDVIAVLDNKRAINMTGMADADVITNLLDLGKEMNRVPLTVRAPREIGTAMFRTFVEDNYGDTQIVARFGSKGNMYNLVKDTHCLITTCDDDGNFVCLELC